MWLGIEYYDKNVTNQMIEFMNYYICETLQEAKTYRDYASKSKIDVADMRLAISSQNYESFVRPISISTLREVAAQKNAIPLPAIETIASVTDETT